MVGREAPFHCITEKLLKPDPVIVRVDGPVPAWTLAGETELTEGAGLVIGDERPHRAKDPDARHSDLAKDACIRNR